MFNLSGSEIIVILLLALVVLGPEKLPDAIRRAGRTYSELKKMGNSFQAEMKSVLDEPMKEMRDTADLLKKSMDFTDGELTGNPTTATTPRVNTTAAKRTAAAAPPVATETSPVDEPRDDVVTEGSSGSVPVPDAADDAAKSAPTPTSGQDAQLSPDDELINRTLSGEA